MFREKKHLEGILRSQVDNIKACVNEFQNSVSFDDTPPFFSVDEDIRTEICFIVFLEEWNSIRSDMTKSKDTEDDFTDFEYVSYAALINHLYLTHFLGRI